MKIKFIKKCVWAFKTVRDDQYKVVKGHTVCFDPTDTFVDMEEGVARQMIMAGYAIEKNVSESSEKEGSKGTFVFANVDLEFVDDFDLGKVEVEPVTFNMLDYLLIASQ